MKVKTLTKQQSHMADETKPKSAFYDSLVRNNSKIRADRALAIMEDAELIYKRKVEDLHIQINQLLRQRRNALDLSGDSALSLQPAKDFNATLFAETDLKLAQDLRNLRITLKLAQESYDFFFGDGPEPTSFID